MSIYYIQGSMMVTEIRCKWDEKVCLVGENSPVLDLTQVEGNPATTKV